MYSRVHVHWGTVKVSEMYSEVHFNVQLMSENVTPFPGISVVFEFSSDLR